MNPFRSQPAILRFKNAADGYCQCLDKVLADKAPLQEILFTLSEVYAAAHFLPPVHESQIDVIDIPPENLYVPIKSWELVKKLSAMFTKDGRIAHVFNPWDDPANAAVEGYIGDELLDIYNDLRKGLALWNTKDSYTAEAVYGWRESFVLHWGRHAVVALHALHTYIYYKK